MHFPKTNNSKTSQIVCYEMNTNDEFIDVFTKVYTTLNVSEHDIQFVFDADDNYIDANDTPNDMDIKDKDDIRCYFNNTNTNTNSKSIRIFVKFDDKQIQLTTQENATVQTLKRQIKTQTQISCHQQRIELRGNTLDDSKTLLEYQITNNTVVTCVERSKIYVTAPSDKFQDRIFWVRGNTKLSKVMLHCCKQWKINSNQSVRFLYNQVELDPDKMITDVNMGHNDTIICQFVDATEMSSEENESDTNTHEMKLPTDDMQLDRQLVKKMPIGGVISRVVNVSTRFFTPISHQDTNQYNVQEVIKKNGVWTRIREPWIMMFFSAQEFDVIQTEPITSGIIYMGPSSMYQNFFKIRHILILSADCDNYLSLLPTDEEFDYTNSIAIRINSVADAHIVRLVVNGSQYIKTIRILRHNQMVLRINNLYLLYKGEQVLVWDGFVNNSLKVRKTANFSWHEGKNNYTVNTFFRFSKFQHFEALFFLSVHG